MQSRPALNTRLLTVKPKIFTFWNGEQPDWLKHTLWSIKRFHPGLEVIDQEKWQDILQQAGDDLDLDFSQPMPSISNVIRLYLLYKNGGVWIDTDCVLIQSLDYLFELLEDNEMVGFNEFDKIGMNWIDNPILGMQKNSPLGYKILNETYEKTISCDWNEEKPTTNGSHILTKYYRQIRTLPSSMIYPIHWRDYDKWFEKDELKLPNYTLAAHLTKGVIKNLPKLDGQTKIAQLFQKYTSLNREHGE